MKGSSLHRFCQNGIQNIRRQATVRGEGRLSCSLVRSCWAESLAAVERLQVVTITRVKSAMETDPEERVSKQIGKH